MLRLFISFYFAVILSIFVVNLTTEYLWQHFYQNEDTETHYVTQVAKPLQQILDNHHDIASYTATIDNTEVFDIGDVAWLPEQLTKLKQNEPVITYDAAQAFFLNLPLNNASQILRLGPFYPSSTSSISRWVIFALSYVGLALLLALWVRPIWHDLQQLTQMTKKIALGDLAIENTHTTRSAITPLMNTMQDLAGRIIRLMADQKQLVNAVSHELRTPIARLKFAIAMLDHVEPQQKEELNGDLAEMEQLVNEMLSYARLEAHTESFTKEPCNLSALIEALVQKIRRQTTHTITLDAAENITTMVNAQAIERVIQNILSNAIRYANSHVNVTLTELETKIQITIDDDGPGIAPEQRQEIFTPFHTIDQSRCKKNAGFGLGLAIVKRLLDWHSGQCEISQSPQGGCRFVVVLPKNQH